jgi:hypothetical protein
MMRTTRVLAFLLMSPAIFAAQSVPSPADALLDVLVWGTHMAIDPEAYEPALQLEVQQSGGSPADPFSKHVVEYPIPGIRIIAETLWGLTRAA